MLVLVPGLIGCTQKVHDQGVYLLLCHALVLDDILNVFMLVCNLFGIGIAPEYYLILRVR
jgi:hypothetical protein